MVTYLDSNDAKKYSLSAIDNTFFLAYRDLPSLIKKYVYGKRAIDYGCGTGRSTRFLKSCGFEVLGVDISKEMIKEALEIDQQNHYMLVKNAQIPVLNSSCDFILASLVICTVENRADIIQALKEINRCLTNNGICIITTASNIFYNKEWLSYDTDYPENQNLKSGNIAKFYLKDLDVELKNYYWTDEDNCDFFKQSQLEVVEKIFPLGSTEDNVPWVSETKFAPYAIYVLKKSREE